MFKKFWKILLAELEATHLPTHFGAGWISGVLAIFLSSAGLLTVIYLRYPQWLTVPEIHNAIDASYFKIAQHLLIVSGFLLASISLILRQSKILGFTALALCVAAIAIGSGSAANGAQANSGIYFGLDWFILNLTLTGVIFLPLERLFRRTNQSVLRFEWREDLLYFLISSVMVQSLTFLSLAPSNFLVSNLEISHLQSVIAAQPGWLQFIEIMFVTDFVQYWMHRSFHRVPFLWRFHAVHHSAQAMDWLAGSRMHVLEIIVLRGLTVIPMHLLGFSQPVIYAYLIGVYLYSTYIHANVRFDVEWIKPIIVTPRFHHWHHGIEKEAIDVNFAIHFSFLDKLFGTYNMPKGLWPKGYGVATSPVPSGYFKQMLYPFVKSKG
jgi:sterol desaturase/sphingolipid hydroxylase (fatty acid hydroxylase superfamily)